MKKLAHIIFLTIFSVSASATSIKYDLPKNVILSKADAEKIGITVEVTPNDFLTTYTIKVSDNSKVYRSMTAWLYSNENAITYYLVKPYSLEKENGTEIYKHNIRINNKLVSRINLRIVMGKTAYKLDIHVNDI